MLMGLKIPKLQVGPTLESPGPMLFKVAAIAVKFVEADGDLHQHFDARNKRLPRGFLKIGLQQAEHICPDCSSRLSYQAVAARVFLHKFQIAMPRAIGTHITQLRLHPTLVRKALFQTAAHKGVELIQRQRFHMAIF